MHGSTNGPPSPTQRPIRRVTQDRSSVDAPNSHNQKKPHIVLVIPRGEAVRNFLYSDTLRILKENSRVTVLTVVHDKELIAAIGGYADEIIPLKEYEPHPMSAFLRFVTENAHDRWLWSEVAKNNWELRDRRAKEQGKQLSRRFLKITSCMLSNNPCLHALTSLEQYAHWRLRTTREFDDLFARLKPDLVFNGSHIHGPAGDLPLRVAKRMGIKTAGFIFSWDNLSSRSRIFVPYDYYLVWHDAMKRQLLGIYPRIQPRSVFVTGTPQFDFHFKPEFVLTREELCRRIGLDVQRPFILYTTGIWNHFFEEHRHVELVIRLLGEMPVELKPQLVVRNYAKGTAEELKAMARQKYADVVFPPVLWDERWYTPQHEDLYIYTSLVRHAAMSINAASTVTLEFLMLNKPVINLDFDPPGSNLPWCLGYERHIRFDHFWPIAQSGASMVAKSEEDMRQMLHRGLTQPEAGSKNRCAFVTNCFGNTLDGNSGRRVAEQLLALAQPQGTVVNRMDFPINHRKHLDNRVQPTPHLH